MLQWDLSLGVFAYFLGPPCAISPGNLLPGYDSVSRAEKTSIKQKMENLILFQQHNVQNTQGKKLERKTKMPTDSYMSWNTFCF